MRTSRVFVLGGLMGAAAVWLWGREMEAYVEERTRGVRTKAAEGVRAVEEPAGTVLEGGGHALRRVGPLTASVDAVEAAEHHASLEARSPEP